jgi:glycerol-3-phosphate acyltransferase PlsY
MTQEMIFGAATGYLLGSIPFGLLLARWAGKGDIRDIGSGNIGATNVLRTGSKGLAALTLLFDCFKATVAIILAHHLWGDDAGVAAAAGAFLGHCYPVWLRFKGGKGVATFLGILIPLLPVAAVIYALIWLLVFLATRISSAAGISAAISAPLAAIFFQDMHVFPMLLGLTLVVLWKHRDNIRRLMAGTEPRVGSNA